MVSSSAMKPAGTRRVLAVCGMWLIVLGVFTTALHISLQSNAIGADFYTFWVAGKSLFLDHLNPYSSEVTQVSQMGKFGHLVPPGQDQVAFAYPVYSLFLTAPTAWMSYRWAISLWLALNILGLLTILFLIFSNKPKYLLITSLFFYPIAFGLIVGNFAVPLGIILLFSLHFLVIKRERRIAVQVAAGIILAWATIKPQFMVFYIAFFLLYAIREKLWPFMIAFFSAFGVGFIVSLIFVPTWLSDWYQRIFEYAKYVQSQPTIQFLLASFLPNGLAVWVSWIVIGMAVLVSLFLGWMWWRRRLEDLPFIAWIGMVTYLVHLNGMAYEQITLLVPLILWAAVQYPNSPRAVMGFWIITWIYSWAAFALGRLALPFDRSPILLNAVFVVWLLSRSIHWQELFSRQQVVEV